MGVPLTPFASATVTGYFSHFAEFAWESLSTAYTYPRDSELSEYREWTLAEFTLESLERDLDLLPQDLELWELRL